MKPIILTLQIFLLSSYLTAAPFPERRIAINIGAVAVNYAIADVDPATDTIIKLHDTDSFPIAFHEDLEQSTEITVSAQTQAELVHAVRQVKKRMEYYQVSEFKAIATETFRIARNRVELLGNILGETGIRIDVLDQATEDRLDFFSAIRTSQKSDKPVVWDIGGGGYQLITNSLEQPITANGAYGSVTFLNYLLEVTQNKDHRKTRNIHPLTEYQFEQGLRFARHLARRSPEPITRAIRENHGQVIAVGQLFRNTVLPQSRTRKINHAMLKGYIKKSLNQEATEQHEPDSGRPRKGFSHLALSNAILVYGFMVELGITQLTIAERSSTDSILEFTPFWQ